MFTKDYASVFEGDKRWKSLDTPTGNTFEWDKKSTYVRKPPYFDGMPKQPKAVTDIKGWPLYTSDAADDLTRLNIDLSVI